MDRRSGNRPKKTKTISKSGKNRLDMCPNIPRCCWVSAITREKTIKLRPWHAIAGVYFSQTSVTFVGDLAAFRNGRVSVIARCTQVTFL